MLERWRRERPDEAELTRRRFARRQWAGRWLRMRAVVVAAAVLVVLVIGAWAVFFSSLLAVDGVEVEGNDLLTVEQVEAAAAVPHDVPLARTDLDAIRDRVEELPAVRTADVSRKWPDAILVKVTERVAVAVVEAGGEFRGIDAEGVAFRDFAEQPESLPLIKIDEDTAADARAEGAAVIAALPDDIAQQVEHLELHSIDQISLQLRDGRVVQWGSAEDSADKARVLAVLLDEVEAKEYDVTVPGQATTR
ncbi:FtsQ-type POTRA domain-containing protein [Nocardioides sp. AE5]|uniref:cell division protein FtsQ/DivIB n=1 Tax=Nocardioides sp. AE5 TaxID=2962573 RepID=UPI002882286A|nr:FtsQ-type POTRA domain-containing protein [Nocardioides sp. AE5]MDT0201259.1 FtsQ-type POTRA domain-containing protein [Nocardioides sp. AE5]